MTLMTPTGSFYTVGYPGVQLALELVSLGVERVVFSASGPDAEWADALEILNAADVEVVQHAAHLD